MNQLKPNPWLAAALGVGLCAASGLAMMRADANASGRAAPARPKGTVTFAKDVAPIIYGNCTSCHRAGEVAPFSLSNYQDVKKRATQIASVVQSHYMPPWHADSHGEFLNERKLTDDQIAVLQQWVQEGAKPGTSAPEPPKFAQGWSLGEPDVVLQPSKAYTLKAEGNDVYRCFVLPNTNTDDRYVAAMEVRPGNAKVVHHVIAYLNDNGKAREKEAANTDGQPGYSSFGGIGVTPSGTLGGWAPGNFPRRLPDGIGNPYPKGSDIVLQVHYHPSGKPETDQTRVGIYYCKKPVDKQLRIYPVIAGLNIPAGEPNYTVKSFEFPVPWDATVLEVMPHMHLLGKEMVISAVSPAGEKKTLVNVPHYDFSWQTTYAFKDPVKIAKGSKIGLTARYDNSTSNPRNPSSPPRPVGWGEQTTDEMCIGFVYFTMDDEHITQGKKLGPFGFGTNRRAASALVKGLFQNRPQSTAATAKAETAP